MTADPDSLALHLPGQAADDQSIFNAAAGAGDPLVPPPGLTFLSDFDRGWVLFMRDGFAALTVPIATPSGFGLTLMAWLQPSGDLLGARTWPIFSCAGSAPGDHLFSLQVEGEIIRVQLAGRTFSAKAEGQDFSQWHHLAAAWDGGQHELVIYLDGQRLERFTTPFGMLRYPPGARMVEIGDGQDTPQGTAYHGKLAGLRMYGRGLPEAEVHSLFESERLAMPPFDHLHPLTFRVADERGTPTIAIVDDDSRGRQLHFLIGNVAPVPIVLPGPEESVRRGRKLTAHGPRLPHEEDHHLEIVFRPGTLDPAFLDEISPIDADWLLETAVNRDGTLSLFLIRADGYIIPPNGFLSVTLAHVRAAVSGGSRSSQVLLRYRQLHYLESGSDLDGYRLAHVSVVNQRGKAAVPLAAGFIGSHTVLNDGITNNKLMLYLGNPSTHRLSLLPGESGASPRIILSFTGGLRETLDEPWALAHVDQLAEIEIEARALGWVIRKHDESRLPEWVIDPPPAFLPGAHWVEFSLFPIKTAFPAGMSQLHLRYENFDGFRDGTLHVLIEKSPVALWEASRPPVHGVTPDPARSVLGISDSAIVGRDFLSDVSTGQPFQPEEPGTLLVAGKVGIGTKGPLHAALTVEGQIRASGDVFNGHGLVVPIGSIVMWSNYKGSPIPDGWQLCDGTNGTPDLRGRFVVGHAPEAPVTPDRPKPSAEKAEDCKTISSVGGVAHVRRANFGNTVEFHGPISLPKVLVHTIRSQPPGREAVVAAGNLLDEIYFREAIKNTGMIEMPAEFAFSFQTEGVQAHDNRPPYLVLAYIMKVE
jgi:hypothetical protein